MTLDLVPAALAEQLPRVLKALQDQDLDQLQVIVDERQREALILCEAQLWEDTRDGYRRRDGLTLQRGVPADSIRPQDAVMPHLSATKAPAAGWWTLYFWPEHEGFVSLVCFRALDLLAALQHVAQRWPMAPWWQDVGGAEMSRIARHDLIVAGS